LPANQNSSPITFWRARGWRWSIKAANVVGRYHGHSEADGTAMIFKLLNYRPAGIWLLMKDDGT
jgi:hypothetical protein